MYGILQLALFGWQSSTLSACKSNLLASINRQCQDYCPCVNTYETVASSLLECNAQTHIAQTQRPRDAATPQNPRDFDPPRAAPSPLAHP